MIIKVVYIATGDYKRMWHGFKESLSQFCPEAEKKVIVYSDLPLGGADEYTYITRHPWPIIALQKLSVMLHESGKNDSDYIVYFNSNIEMNDTIGVDEFFFKDKVTAVEHCSWNKLQDPYKYTRGEMNSGSLADIKGNDYIYLQSSVFGGPNHLLHEFMDKAVTAMKMDLAANIIPVYHDESYWNKVCLENLDKVKILPNDFNADQVHWKEWGTAKPRIWMRDSSLTQNKMKDSLFYGRGGFSWKI